MPLLIRHGEPAIDPTQPAHTWPLSERGRQQVRTLAGRIGHRKLQRIITSREPKALATGQVLAEALALPLSSAPGLEEHDRRTVAWQPSYELFEAEVIRFFRRPDELVMGGETAVQAQQRFSQALAGIERQYRNERLAIVSHGTVIALHVAAHGDDDPLAVWRAIQAAGMPALVYRTGNGRQWEIAGI